MVRVWESNIIFPFFRPSRYLLLNRWAKFKQTCYMASPHGKGCESNIIFPCVRLSVHPSSVQCPSCYLLLNHWMKFNKTCYISSLHSNSVRKQYYFSERPSSVHLSVTLSLPRWNSAKLTTSFLLMVGVCESNTFFRASVQMSVTLSLPKPLGKTQSNMLHHIPLR